MIKRLYRDTVFIFYFDVMPYIENLYESKLKEEMNKNRNGKIVHMPKPLDLDDLAKFLYETFEEVLPRDREIEIHRFFFNFYFKDFSIEFEENTDQTDGVNFVDLKPVFHCETAYLTRFEDIEYRR